MKRITIKDVAQVSGYSISTVSLALSDKPTKVSSETKEKIKKIAAELNYSPNQLAVGLKTRRSKKIGIVIGDLRNPHISNIFMIIDKVLRDKGYFLICYTFDTSKYFDIQRFNDLIACGIDGIIFLNPSLYYSAEKQETIKNTILNSHLPVVSCDNTDFYKDHLGSSVNVNYEEGAYLATKHLIALGHKNIGCVTGPMDLKITGFRLDGYKRALNEYSIDFNPNLIYEGDYEIESGYAALPYLLGQNISAIFSFNDNMAFGLFKSARSFGIKIPDDLSIIGFDDVSFDEILETPLTSIHIHADEIGRSMAEEITRLIDDEDAEYRIIEYEPYLMVRGSTKQNN